MKRAIPRPQRPRYRGTPYTLLSDEGKVKRVARHVAPTKDQVDHFVSAIKMSLRENSRRPEWHNMLGGQRVG